MLEVRPLLPQDIPVQFNSQLDYVKCTFPLVCFFVHAPGPRAHYAQSFTLMSVCWGALDYGEGN